MPHKSSRTFVDSVTAHKVLELDVDLGIVEKDIQKIQLKLEDHDHRFNEHDIRFDRLEDKLDSVIDLVFKMDEEWNVRFNKLETEVQEIKEQLRKITNLLITHFKIA